MAYLHILFEVHSLAERRLFAMAPRTDHLYSTMNCLLHCIAKPAEVVAHLKIYIWIPCLCGHKVDARMDPRSGKLHCNVGKYIEWHCNRIIDKIPPFRLLDSIIVLFNVFAIIITDHCTAT